MDPVSLAGIVVPLLVHYLKEISQPLAERAGTALDETATRWLARIHDRVRSGLAPDPFAAEALNRLKEESANELRQATLRTALAEILTEQPAFLADLTRLVEDAQTEAGQTVTTIIGSGATSVRGNINLQGSQVAGRDLHIGKLPS